MRYLFALVALLLLILGGAFLVAGRMAGPSIQIERPERFVGQSTPMDVVVGTPGAELSAMTIEIEQAGKRVQLYSLDAPDGAEVKQDGEDRIRVTRDVGRQGVPELQSGPARIIVTAARPVMYGLRQAESTDARDVQVRLERPRVSIVSTHHFVNHGGAEVVVYRATPEDVESGVVVGEIEYPGFPATGLNVPGISINDPAVRVAFFALRHDQDLQAPIRLFARDEAGNTARADFDFRVFPKPFKKSRIEIDDRFLGRVVPAILEGTDEVNPPGELIDQFLVVNGELRRLNNEKIASFAADTAPVMLWGGEPFYAFRNTGVQSAFADHRTYFYKGREIDQQVHLGFDLASYMSTPIVASGAGRVLFADELGIYGNTVILDHGLGVQSLYSHLSSIEVRAGDTVSRQQQLGRSGMTGMAGGDHLHFTMLVNGQMVNPIEWWDPKWINDRIMRKLRDAGAAPQGQQ
jgi:murein DD-endopeptidase MepM/ murein hydrolase activator NlpD